MDMAPEAMGLLFVRSTVYKDLSDALRTDDARISYQLMIQIEFVSGRNDANKGSMLNTFAVQVMVKNITQHTGSRMKQGTQKGAQSQLPPIFDERLLCPVTGHGQCPCCTEHLR